MAFPEHRYIQASRFRNKVEYSIFSSQVQTDSALTSDILDASGTAWFAFMPETGLTRGESTGEEIEPVGLIKTSTDIHAVFKFSSKIYNALMDRKKVVMRYRERDYRATDFVNIGGERVYLSIVLRRVEYGQSY